MALVVLFVRGVFFMGNLVRGGDGRQLSLFVDALHHGFLALCARARRSARPTRCIRRSRSDLVRDQGLD